MNWVWQKIDLHLIQPFLHTHAPVHQVAWGAVVGMFVALTPTVGAQMYIVTVIWVISRYLFRFKFNLPIGVALVWISNPATVVPMYYVFLLSGDWLLSLIDGMAPDRDLEHFRAVVTGQVGEENTGLWDRLLHGVLLLFWEYGWPMAVGSLIWAIPGAIAAYPLVSRYLHQYRRIKAQREGISYQAWQARHVREE